MIISPPFLIARNANEAEDSWLARAMPLADSGTYPVSELLGWHGGIHLRAPSAGTGTEPIRAIADGTIAYVRQPTQQSDSHALNYLGWTDDGCVVLKHDTSIGADDTTETEVRFYSIYLHLNTIRSTVKPGEKIHRKAELGTAGSFEGTSGIIHFEIICDDANLKKLMGRNSGDLETSKNGRTDAIFGEIFFKLPSTTQVYAQRPVLNQTAGAGGTALGEELFVGIRYAAGDAKVTTYKADGKTLGNVLTEADAEYNLYATSAQIVTAYVGQADAPVQSAVYELLRFGRAVGPDPLKPADTPHWRQIATPTGTGWVNLNGSGVTKSSDADAPHWSGWHLLNEYQTDDSRCSITTIKKLLDANSDGINTLEEAASQLKKAPIINFLAGTICKFPTEWQKSTIATRWDWTTKESPPGSPANSVGSTTYLTQKDFVKFQSYAEALCFWDEAKLEGMEVAHWHFHPIRFIDHFRRCGWLSKREVIRATRKTVPEKNKKTQVMTESGALTWEAMKSRLETASAKRPENIHIPIQKMCAKYLITTPLRIAHLGGQLAAETGRLELMVEGGADSYFDKYEPGTDQGKKLGNTEVGDGLRFKGRGLIQITGRSNYTKYGEYRGKQFITDETSSLLLTNAYNSCDASGNYWAKKQRYSIDKKGKLVEMGKPGINHWADKGKSDSNQKDLTKCINPGLMHFEIRSACFYHAFYCIGDEKSPPADYIAITEPSS
ncbi:hypothetical protein BO993_01800 [Xanthomonas oryzae pv. oryzae]|nr:hypothetical protein BO993_01800 [Xanthomonas oryzae pv. oryzae]